MALNRNYNFKDVDMLMAAKTVTESFKANIGELSVIRTNWNEEYANQIADKIDDAIENYLGVDKKKELRSATSKLSAIQMPALRDVSFLKTQLEVDFSDDKTKLKEILKQLGFNDYLKQAQKKDQEALIQLLFKIKSNLTDSMRAEIISKGLSSELLDRIIEYAVQLKDANVSQETLKEGTKETSSQIAKIFNGIYNEVIGICKIATNYYTYDELKKELFTFSKVVSNMNAAKRISNQPEE
ncbi:MAG: hypothetical protein PHY85_03840 [Bacteroidales bacterium]|nr:hypothetical protein [Bacteroidales bacterium]